MFEAFLFFSRHIIRQEDVRFLREPTIQSSIPGVDDGESGYGNANPRVSENIWLEGDGTMGSTYTVQPFSIVILEEQ